ncbi:MAG: hypothetical protein KTR17_11960 [Cellvibrionaceae bacterium]|nr:hypothetical protein [Cellvibrionaceae bacterium]
MYAGIKNSNPSQLNLKHLLKRESYCVYGKLIDKKAQYAVVEIFVATYSGKYKDNEQVDSMFITGSGTHFGLNLPEEKYSILVFADIDQNNFFEASESVGKLEIELNPTQSPEKIMGEADVVLGSQTTQKL